MRIKREHLSLLFNHLYDRGDERFAVEHPCEAVGKLASIALGNPHASRVRFAMDRDAYANVRNDVALEYGDRVAKDLPRPDDYCNVALASGLVEIENLDEVSTFVDRYGDPSLMDGHSPVFAGFDTNLMTWRIDRILGLREPDEGVGFVNGFVLSTGVRDELEWGDKYHDVDDFVDAYGDVAEEYWNQPVGSTRISRLGLSAYRELRDIHQATEIGCDRGDEAIVEAYDAWQDDVRGQVLLFSDDRDFVERARAHSILAERVVLPRTIPGEVEASWLDIELLVYLLTVVFGVVEVPGAVLHGVWRGKEGSDWQEERVKVNTRSPKLENALTADLSVVETYDELKQPH